MRFDHNVFVADLVANIRKTIRAHRADGCVAIHPACLQSIVQPPAYGPRGVNAAWVYDQIFDEALAALPVPDRAFVDRR